MLPQYLVGHLKATQALVQEMVLVSTLVRPPLFMSQGPTTALARSSPPQCLPVFLINLHLTISLSFTSTYQHQIIIHVALA